MLGYLMFGEGTLSQITLNLPKHAVSSKIALWTTVSPKIFGVSEKHWYVNTFKWFLSK